MNPWTWDTLTRRPAPTPATLAKLSQLRAALPGYDVTLTSHSGSYRFEAVRRPGGPQDGPWCLISIDAADLWRELAPWTRYGASMVQAGASASFPLHGSQPGAGG